MRKAEGEEGGRGYSRVRCRAVVTVGLLFDGGRDDGRVWDACLVQAVGVVGHHVWREAARHQTAWRTGGEESTTHTVKKDLVS